MKRVYIAALIIIILIIGCAKDIIVQPPNSLKGVYNGKYSVTHEYGSSTGGITIEQWIEWTFTDYKFYSKAAKTDLLPQAFCDVSGNYELKSNITLTDTLVSAQVCDHGDVPVGSFSLLRKAGEDGVPDSIYMEQIAGDIRKVIMLEKSE